jgi:sporulation and spore germination protein
MIAPRPGRVHRAVAVAGCVAILGMAQACGGGRREADAQAGAGSGDGAETPAAADQTAAAGVAGGPAEGAASTGQSGSEAANPPGAGEAPSADAASVGAPAAAPTEPNHREVVLFFQRPDDDTLGPERRKILLTPSVADTARQIVDALALGPESGDLLPTIPQKTTVRGIYLDKGGTAFVDLSEEFVSNHPGGSSDELATIFSVVDSLTYNLPEIRRVRFLVGGEERDTLKNHLDLRSAYLKDMSIVRMENGG